VLWGELLSTLQDAFKLVTTGAGIANQLAESWTAELQAILDREADVRKSTDELLNEIYPDEPPALRRGRLNTSPAMVAWRQEVSTARNNLNQAQQEVKRLVETRTSVAREIELVCQELTT
jgi:hypothetical protein